MFTRLAGNAHVVDTLRRFLKSRRVPNSLLFAGMDGVGKKQFAFELAKALVCQDVRDHEGCGECAACRRVNTVELPAAAAKGEDYDRVFFTEHPDVGTVIPFNRTLRVGSIRALEIEANFRPFEAAARIFIIDDADKMNDSSANALLKTLEEPPATSHIFLISSRPDKLLPTIRSRCQVLRFAPVEAGEIEKLLLRSHQYSQEDARLVAAFSRGSVARAVGADIGEFRDQRKIALDILRTAIMDQDRVALLRAAESIGDARNKAGFEDFLDTLQSLIRDVWILSKHEAGISNRDLEDELAVLSAKADPYSPSRWITEIEEIRQCLAVNISKKIASDALVVGMAGSTN